MVNTRVQSRLEWARVGIVILLVAGYFLANMSIGVEHTVIGVGAMLYLAGWLFARNRYALSALWVDLIMITAVVFYTRNPYFGALYAIPLGSMALRGAAWFVLVATYVLSVAAMWLSRPVLGVWTETWAIAGALAAYLATVENWSLAQSSSANQIADLEDRLRKQQAVTNEMVLRSVALSQGGLHQAAIQIAQSTDSIMVQDTLTNAALELTGAQMAILYLRNEKDEYVLATRKAKAAGAGALDYLPQQITTEDAKKSIGSGRTLIAPLESNGEVIGSLRVLEKEYFGGQFTGEFFIEDYQICSVLTALAATSLDKIAAYTATKEMAETDALTRLPNRRVFLAKAADELTRKQRYGHDFCIALLDLDHFKQANDTFGHNFGDEVLKTVAHTLRQVIRATDVAARWGGEEFVLLLPNTPEASEITERVRSAIQSLRFPEREITVSVGWAKAAPDAKTILELVEQADKALYHAKETGRNRVVQYEPGMKGKPKV